MLGQALLGLLHSNLQVIQKVTPKSRHDASKWMVGDKDDEDKSGPTIWANGACEVAAPPLTFPPVTSNQITIYRKYSDSRSLSLQCRNARSRSRSEP